MIIHNYNFKYPVRTPLAVAPQKNRQHKSIM